jgi:hypothetical protein
MRELETLTRLRNRASVTSLSVTCAVGAGRSPALSNWGKKILAPVRPAFAPIGLNEPAFATSRLAAQMQQHCDPLLVNKALAASRSLLITLKLLNPLLFPFQPSPNAAIGSRRAAPTGTAAAAIEILADDAQPGTIAIGGAVSFRTGTRRPIVPTPHGQMRTSSLDAICLRNSRNSFERQTNGLFLGLFDHIHCRVSSAQ